MTVLPRLAGEAPVFAASLGLLQPMSAAGGASPVPVRAVAAAASMRHSPIPMLPTTVPGGGDAPLGLDLSFLAAMTPIRPQDEGSSAFDPSDDLLGLTMSDLGLGEPSSERASERASPLASEPPSAGPMSDFLSLFAAADPTPATPSDPADLLPETRALLDRLPDLSFMTATLLV